MEARQEAEQAGQTASADTSGEHTQTAQCPMWEADEPCNDPKCPIHA